MHVPSGAVTVLIPSSHFPCSPIRSCSPLCAPCSLLLAPCSLLRAPPSRPLTALAAALLPLTTAVCLRRHRVVYTSPDIVQRAPPRASRPTQSLDADPRYAPATCNLLPATCYQSRTESHEAATQPLSHSPRASLVVGDSGGVATSRPGLEGWGRRRWGAGRGARCAVHGARREKQRAQNCETLASGGMKDCQHHASELHDI